MAATPEASRGAPSPGMHGVSVGRSAEIIDLSHRRSRAFGIATTDAPDFSSPQLGDLNQALDENRFLFQHAAPVMEMLGEQIANTHSMVILTSSKGVVLHSLGDNDFLAQTARVAIKPGMDCSERSLGTNAIGTALAEEEAVTVLGAQHYMQACQFLGCSCAPIFNPLGQVIGALDITCDYSSFHQHTLALVRMSTQMIENHMFSDLFAQAIRIHFHARAEFLGSLVEGIVVFSPEGRFLSANRSAQFQLGLSIKALQAHTFSSLFSLSVSGLHQIFAAGSPAPKQLCLHNGAPVWCRVKHKQTRSWTHLPAPPPTPASAEARRPPMSALRQLDTGDAQIAAVIQKLHMVRGRDIPIMILGETGTGKGLLAQAIHGDSERRGQPFVSVNCASIPETLIESELFGYEEGAFTGARKKGATGKIQQASGGTLFLDEIGDMPKHLQARLLRVLQERKVSPLGAGKEIDVDIAVVCATNKNLKGMIATGEFREDLYYRLNGLMVRLPALRDRSDFDTVIHRMLHALCLQADDVRISSEVMRMFRTYAWPGNFRQLHNLLRTAVAMVGGQGNIQAEHLPDDFLEEICSTQATASLACAMPQEAPSWTWPNTAISQTDTGRLQHVALGAMAEMLRLHKGNVSAAAKALGVSRNTIYRRKAQLPTDVWR